MMKITPMPENRSIFTAITELVDGMKEINKMNLHSKDNSSIIVPLIVAEDISAAFESVPHLGIYRCVARMQELDTLSETSYKNVECKIDRITLSYLD